MKMLKKHTDISAFYFFLIAALGVFLRLFAVFEIPGTYRYLVHTHSHIALLGWVYTALLTLIYRVFLKDKPIAKKYRRIFWSTQITLAGMLLTFPFTGYALFSIIFSSLFLIVSYWFAYFFFKHTTAAQKKTQSYKLIRIALWYMILSSIGPWSLGGIMTTVGSASPWYKNAIYFYLHFQYNGWFLLALFGIFFCILERRSYNLPQKVFRRFFILLNLGVILTLFISILWMRPPFIFYLLALTGGALQMIAFWVFLKELFSKGLNILRSLPQKTKLLLKIIAITLGLKLFAQFIGSFPVAIDIISRNTDFVISYIHWMFLGVVSISIFAFLNYYRLLRISVPVFVIYLVGFFSTEALIFYRGVSSWWGTLPIPNISFFIANASVVILIAAGFLLLNQFLRKKI